jgi:uncharacterized repeat protein (TIGR04052 family)
MERLYLIKRLMANINDNNQGSQLRKLPSTLMMKQLAVFLCAFFTLMGCGKINDDNQAFNKLLISPSYQAKSLSCGETFNRTDVKWQYQQLQMYLSNISLKNDEGQWHKASLIPSKFQTAEVALVGEVCGQESHWQLSFAENDLLEEAAAIRFTLGVPFSQNHVNPLTQTSPLNIPSMFWGWQTGHKFLRLEVLAEQDNWLFHLGSVGCKASSPLRAPKKPCLYPNRFDYQISLTSNKDKAMNVINFELSALLDQVNIGQHNHCQSDPDSNICQQLFNNLQKQNKEAVFQQVENE